MMKNKYFSMVALAAAALATSCSTDELTEQKQQPNGGQTVTLTASMGGDNTTRVGMSKNNSAVSFYWHANDQILVQTKNNTEIFGTKFTIADGTATGATTATFNCTLDEGWSVGNYAMYPAYEEHRMESDNLTFFLPNDYRPTTVEANIFSKGDSYPSNSTNMPMLGTIDNGKISFKHLGGLLVIRIDKMPNSTGWIVVSSDQQLQGSFTVKGLSEGSTPYIETSASSNNTICCASFAYSNATAGGVGVFYLPVPTGEYTNLKISVDGVTAEYGSLKVDRADVITIPVYKGSDGTSYSCTYEVNGHKFIDLCLPSGTLWAETNVGAASATDDGDFFAWGETAPKSHYNWNTYKYGTSNNLTKYNSTEKTVLDKEDDAAYMNWGSFCRMPTYQEFTELFNTAYCTGTWTSKTASDGTTSINGYEVTSKKNGNSIFLPASGYNYGIIYGHGTEGQYWSSTLSDPIKDPNCSYYFYFRNGDSGDFTYYFYAGKSVRPVAKPYSTPSSSTAVPDMTTSGIDSGWE